MDVAAGSDDLIEGVAVGAVGRHAHLDVHTAAGGPTVLVRPPVCIPLASSLRPRGRQLSAASYFLGHGAVYVAVATCSVRPPSPANFSSAFSGKPPFGHFFGTVP